MSKEDNIRGLTKGLSLTRLLCTFPVKWNTKLSRFEELPLKWFYLCRLVFLTFSMSVASTFIVIEKVGNYDVPVALELSQVFVSIIVLFYFYFTRENLVMCMNSLQDIDERMKFLGATINYRTMKYYIFKYAITFLCIAVNNVDYIRYTKQNYQQCIIYFVTNNITFLISSSVLSHFCAFILVAMDRLRTLNNSITNLVLKGKFDRENRRNKLVFDEYNLAKSLRYISVIHWDITKLAKLVNKTFTLQLLLSFFKVFLTILAALHSIVKKQIGTLVMYDLFWSLFTVVEVIYMLQVCTECIQLSKTSTHLINMLQAKNDSKLNFEKGMFLLQSLHHGLDFTAFGFFPINKTVFLKLCDTVVTYVMLITQFESLKKN